jgi:hypothetical protein
MTRTPTWRFAFVALSAIALMVLAGPVAAHHKSGHAGGPPSDGNGDTVTEDNDGDGFANAPDRFGDTDNAHPSGKDKHVEHGGSVNQGKSGSDPDSDGNGGVDKPAGAGGLDIEDQDGNNGCGNDDDFEDDNNGNCGGEKDQQGNGGNGGNGGGNGVTQVGSVAGVAGVTAAGAPAPTAVLGAGAARERAAPAPAVAAAAGELAFTGVNVTFWLGGALGLALLGFAFAYAGRRLGRT